MAMLSRQLYAAHFIANSFTTFHYQLFLFLTVVRLSPYNAKRCRRDVAQLGSASGLGPEGRGFESRRPDHLYLGVSYLNVRL